MGRKITFWTREGIYGPRKTSRIIENAKIIVFLIWRAIRAKRIKTPDYLISEKNVIKMQFWNITEKLLNAIFTQNFVTENVTNNVPFTVLILHYGINFKIYLSNILSSGGKYGNKLFFRE